MQRHACCQSLKKFTILKLSLFAIGLLYSSWRMFTPWQLSFSSFVIFLSLNATPLLQNYVDWDKFFDRKFVAQLIDGESFDFIIGSGSSGSTLASRLSQDYRVLLLEAGGVPCPLISLSALSFVMNGQAPIDWRYRTVPQKHAAFGLNDNVAFWGSGKGLGGSSLINTAIFLRGNTQGFDTIAKETGDSIWNLKNIINYYKNMEDYNGYFAYESLSHGNGGELGIETGINVPFIDNLLRAGQELGYKRRDPNGYGALTEGFAPMDFYEKFGRKQDAYTSSLKHVIGRPKLVIRKFSFVRQLLLNGTTAYGVEYERHNMILRAVARKEIILCAGTIQNPKLLMLAGIGPKEHLEEHQIPLRVDLPVGKILEDSYGAQVGPFVVDDGTSFRESREYTIPRFLQWFFYGTGPTATGRFEASYQILSDFAKSEGRIDTPDVHTYVEAISPGSLVDYMAPTSFNFNQQFVNYINNARSEDAFFQVVTLSKPFSHGTLRLADSNPNSYPIIDPNYLADPRDLRALVDGKYTQEIFAPGLKFAVKLVEETKAFKDINGRLISVPYPGCEQFFFKSDPYYECIGRHATVSSFRYGGTTLMGINQSDPNAVVDSRFRVLGTKGLRVVGGSVHRLSTVSVNDVTCRMLGILAADMIKSEWQK